MAAPAAREGQRAGSAAVLLAGTVLADEPAAFPGERLVTTLIVLGPSVPRPMGWRSDPQCRADLLKASVVLRSLEP